MDFRPEPLATATQGCPVRAVRFIKLWRGKIGRDDKRDEYLTQGIREQVVWRGFAEWDDSPAKAEKRKPQREGAVPQ